MVVQGQKGKKEVDFLTDDDLREIRVALESRMENLGYARHWAAENSREWPRPLKNVRRVLNKVRREQVHRRDEHKRILPMF